MLTLGAQALSSARLAVGVCHHRLSWSPEQTHAQAHSLPGSSMALLAEVTRSDDTPVCEGSDAPPRHTTAQWSWLPEWGLLPPRAGQVSPVLCATSGDTPALHTWTTAWKRQHRRALRWVFRGRADSAVTAFPAEAHTLADACP